MKKLEAYRAPLAHYYAALFGEGNAFTTTYQHLGGTVTVQWLVCSWNRAGKFVVPEQAKFEYGKQRVEVKFESVADGVDSTDYRTQRSTGTEARRAYSVRCAGPCYSPEALAVAFAAEAETLARRTYNFDTYINNLVDKQLADDHEVRVASVFEMFTGVPDLQHLNPYAGARSLDKLIKRPGVHVARVGTYARNKRPFHVDLELSAEEVPEFLAWLLKEDER